MASAMALGAVRIAGALLAGYVLLVGLLYWRQYSLLYQASRVSAVDALRIAGERRLRRWPGGEVRAYIREVPDARATVVVFHGNAGTALDRDYLADALEPLGVRVVLAEYPGYGERPGELGEASLAADAAATLAAARAAFPGPLIGWGESLGAGVLASAMAMRPGLVDGLVLLTPWDRLAGPAQHHYPYLPVRWMLRDTYDTVGNLAGYRGPKVVLVAEHDQVIPARFGEALYAALDAPKHRHVFVGAGHNSWPADARETWWRRVVEQILPPPGQS
jgi:alpha-beta hydrolase superfamily lysophospholipase